MFSLAGIDHRNPLTFYGEDQLDEVIDIDIN